MKNPPDKADDPIPADRRNERDLYLLRNDPPQLVVEYRVIIQTIVAMFVRSGMFRPSDFEEIVQTVTADFLTLLPSIVRQFNGSVLVRTYISAILRNCCLHVDRRRGFDPVRLVSFVDFEGGPMDPHSHPEARACIGMEASVLKAILAQFGGKRPRLVLMLKVRYGIPVTREDILAWFPQCSTTDQARLIEELGPGQADRSEKTRYLSLLPVLAKAEPRHQTLANVRRWTLDHVQQVISLLNGRPPVSAHTSETLGLLLFEIFSPLSVQKSYRRQDHKEEPHGRPHHPQGRRRTPDR